MTVKSKRHQNLMPLSTGAQQAGLTSQGLLKILRRTGNAVRDDGHWYADPTIVDQIATARRVLGLEKSREGDELLKPIAKRPVSTNPPFVTKRPAPRGLKKSSEALSLRGHICGDNPGLTAGDAGDDLLQPPPAVSETRT
jgi:hypothetical protein